MNVSTSKNILFTCFIRVEKDSLSRYIRVHSFKTYVDIIYVYIYYIRKMLIINLFRYIIVIYIRSKVEFS